MYAILLTSAILRNQSFKQIIESGRGLTLKNKVLTYLADNSDKSYTRAQLIDLLGIMPQSICRPLLELKELGLIIIVGAVYDKKTNRPVSAYQIAKTIFS